MKHFRTAVFIGGLSLLSSGYSKEPATLHVLESKLPKSEQSISEQLNRKRSPFAFENVGEVTNCKGYLERSATHNPEGTTRNALIQSEYQSCSALQEISVAVQNGASLRRSIGQQRALAIEVCKNLNVATFPSTLSMQFSTQTAYFSDLKDFSVRVIKGSCVARAPSHHVAITPAIKKGKQLLVWVSDEILDGTYRSYDAVWIDTADPKTWRVGN